MKKVFQRIEKGTKRYIRRHWVYFVLVIWAIVYLTNSILWKNEQSPIITKWDRFYFSQGMWSTMIVIWVIGLIEEIIKGDKKDL